MKARIGKLDNHMKESRHVAILQELDKNEVVSVKDLSDLLGVTDMTIRRDLMDLEEQGLLVRVHGGAHRKIKDSLMEASHLEKNMLNVEEKKEATTFTAFFISIKTWQKQM